MESITKLISMQKLLPKRLKLFARYAREAVSIRTGRRNSGIVLLCEHGGFRIPAPWGTLGLPESFTGTHYGYDLGSRNLTLKIAEMLDATAIVSNYSRLFLDYNRKSHDPSCIRPDMGGIPVPYNEQISEDERELREKIYVGLPEVRQDIALDPRGCEGFGVGWLQDGKSLLRQVPRVPEGASARPAGFSNSVVVAIDE